MRKSLRVPYNSVSEAGSERTANSGDKLSAPSSFTASARTRLIAPLPTQPSTNTISLAG